MNSVILVGNLGSDPELRHTQSQVAVCNFSVATTKKKKDASGTWNDHTEWHKIVAWGKTAESAAKYLSKGKKVCVQGELQTRSWEDKEGQKRYQVEINASSLEFLSPRSEGNSQAANTGGGFPENDNSWPEDNTPKGNLDDIPF